MSYIPTITLSTKVIPVIDFTDGPVIWCNVLVSQKWRQIIGKNYFKSILMSILFDTVLELILWVVLVS